MSEFFVRRPIVAIVIAILMTLIGGVCILALPIAQYPQIAPPEIQVQTHYTGADALTIEQSVAAPIEQQMSGVDNMNYMYSINANSGDIRLIVNFDVATDPNIDQVLTQLRVAQAQSQLPPDVNNYGVTVKKSTTAPLMLISLYSPQGTYDNVFLANYGYINLFDQLTRLPGIGNVQVFGAGQYAMRLWVKPDQLAKLGVTVPEIVTAIQEGIKLIIVLVDSQGFASIGSLSRSLGSGGFGTNYRFRNPATGALDGDTLPVDLAANAASLGAEVFRATDRASLEDALAQARQAARTSVVYVPVDPAARVPGHGCWWDVPVAEVSDQPSVQKARESYEESRRSQRWFL